MIIDIENQIDLFDILRNLLPSELLRYTKSYIKDHTYFKSKYLAHSYLSDYYHYYESNMSRIEKTRVITMLSKRFSCSFTKLASEGIITKYSPKTWIKKEDQNNTNSLDTSFY